MRCKRCYCMLVSLKQVRSILEKNPRMLDDFPNHFYIRVRPFFVKNGVMNSIVEKLREHGFVLIKTQTPKRYDHLTDFFFERRR